MKKKQKPQQTFSKEQVEKMQRFVNEDLKKPQIDHGNNIPHDFDTTMGLVIQAKPLKKK